MGNSQIIEKSWLIKGYVYSNCTYMLEHNYICNCKPILEELYFLGIVNSSWL